MYLSACIALCVIHAYVCVYAHSINGMYCMYKPCVCVQYTVLCM